MNDQQQILESSFDNEWELALSQRDKRALIFHILYMAETHDYQSSLESLIDNLNRGFDLNISHAGSLAKTAYNIIEQRELLDATYRSLLANWRPERLSVATRLILRFALWEFLYTTMPDAVIINEAIELAKSYAEEESYKLINGILDQLAKQRSKKSDD